MKYCPNCKIKIDTDRAYCPLCFREIKPCEGADTGERPFMERNKNETEGRKTAFLLQLFFFISICVVSICLLINLLTRKSVPTEPLWSLVVIAGIVYVWIAVGHTILSRRGVFEKIFMQLIGIMFVLWMCEIISFNTEWLANYVFPSVSMGTVATLLMMTFIKKDKSWILAFFLIIILLTIASILFFIFRDSFQILGIINLAFCSLTLFGYLTFGYKVIKAEFLKKFHL